MSKLEKDTIIDIIDILIGSTYVTGDHNIDTEHAENLQRLLEILDYYVDGIVNLAEYKDRPEASISKIGTLADFWIKSTIATLIENTDGYLLKENPNNEKQK